MWNSSHDRSKTAKNSVQCSIPVPIYFSPGLFVSMNICMCLHASQWDCMGSIVKKDFNVVALSKMRTVTTSISDVVTTSYDVVKTLPKRCYNVNHWVSKCFLIMDIILNSFSSSKRKLKTCWIKITLKPLD